jgi:cytochrome c oxidase assembly protein Cox11
MILGTVALAYGSVPLYKMVRLALPIGDWQNKI